MAIINVSEANAWLEPTKLTLSEIDTNLESQISTLIFGRLQSVYDTTGWVNSLSTPKLVRTILAMHYVAWLYDRTYSDDAEANAYAALLRQMADTNVNGLVAGQIELTEYPSSDNEISSPSFFPTDASSANEPTHDNPSDGGPSFTMGSIF